MKALVVSNCQTYSFANCLQVVAGFPVQGVDQLRLNKLTSEEIDAWDAEYDLAIVWPTAMKRLEGHPIAAKAVTVPSVHFRGFHPDLVYLTFNGARTDKGPLGGCHSAIAFAAFRMGLTADETTSLFTPSVYRAAGYFAGWDTARDAFLTSFRRTDIELEERLPVWCRLGSFMHSIEHPKLRVLFDIAAAVLRKLELPVEAAIEIPDNLANGEVFPVYPEVGEELGVSGSYRFKRPGHASSISLSEFVEKSFAAYGEQRSHWDVVPFHAPVLARTELAIAEAVGVSRG